jgi:osmotically-inducible protein OsmY
MLILAVCLALAACAIIQGTKVENAVLKALAADQRTAEYKFDVSRGDDGTILITGKLFKAEEIAIVTEIAKAVPGVKSVVNRCSIEEPSNGMIQDETVDAPFL